MMSLDVQVAIVKAAMEGKRVQVKRGRKTWISTVRIVYVGSSVGRVQIGLDLCSPPHGEWTNGYELWEIEEIPA